MPDRTYIFADGLPPFEVNSSADGGPEDVPAVVEQALSSGSTISITGLVDVNGGPGVLVLNGKALGAVAIVKVQEQEGHAYPGDEDGPTTTGGNTVPAKP